MLRRRMYTWFALVLVVAMLLAGCGGPTPTPTSPPPTNTPVAAAAPTNTSAPPAPTATAAPATEDLKGQTVSFLAVWAGTELDNFNAMIAPWEAQTGAKVAYEGTRDVNAVLTTRLAGGNPPDIAGLPGPGVMLQLAQQGHLIALDKFMDMATLKKQYDQSWFDLASYNGSIYGLFTKASVKSMIWYNPKAFAKANYQIPKTWDELMALTKEIAQTGTAHWAIGLESGAASGWPGTDWIEDMMLRTAGPDVYDKWRKHEIPWTDPAVKAAFEQWGQIATNNSYIVGGITGMLATNFGAAEYPLWEDPIGGYMCHSADFLESFITTQFPKLQAVNDFDFFILPSIDPQWGAPVESGGDLVGMFNDTPAARSLMNWLASPEAQSIWASKGGFISPNKAVDPSVYPDPLVGKAAQVLASAPAVRFDASDLMPAAVNDAFFKAVLNYVQNPGQLDSILQTVENVAKDAYQ